MKIVLIALLGLFFSCSSDEENVEEVMEAEVADVSTDEVDDEEMIEDSEEGDLNEVAEEESNEVDEEIEDIEAGESTDSVQESIANELQQFDEQTSADVDVPEDTTASQSSSIAVTEGEFQVFYSQQNGTAVLANDKNSTMGSLEKGDRVLGMANGEWVQTSSGGFVKIAMLSTSPIGRERSSSPWASSAN